MLDFSLTLNVFIICYFYGFCWNYLNCFRCKLLFGYCQKIKISFGKGNLSTTNERKSSYQLSNLKMFLLVHDDKNSELTQKKTKWNIVDLVGLVYLWFLICLTRSALISSPNFFLRCLSNLYGLSYESLITYQDKDIVYVRIVDVSFCRYYVTLI